MGCNSEPTDSLAVVTLAHVITKEKMLLKVLVVIGEVILIWLVHYLDKKSEVVLASVGFLALIAYTLMAAAIIAN